MGAAAAKNQDVIRRFTWVIASVNVHLDELRYFWAKALGIFQGGTAAGATAGIVFGGLLTQYLGWRWVLLVNPPVIAILIPLVLLVLPNTPGHARGERLDVPGFLLGRRYEAVCGEPSYFNFYVTRSADVLASAE